MPTHKYEIIYKGRVVETSYTHISHDYAIIRANKNYGKGNYEIKITKLF